MKAAGIVFRPTWVAFTPWTTLDDYLDVLDFIETEGLVDHVDPVQSTIRLLIPPGSMLLDRQAILQFLGPLDEAAFSYRWSHPDHRMDHLHRAVGAMVEEATRAEEDAAITFCRVRSLASVAHGNRMPAVAFPACPDRGNGRRGSPSRGFVERSPRRASSAFSKCGAKASVSRDRARNI